MGVSAASHAEDIEATITANKDLQDAEVMLITSDNGYDYSSDNPLLQHLVGRMWRKHEYVRLVYTAHAPNHSALHFEAEGQWPAANRVLLGQHLGRKAFKGDPMLLQGEDNEDILRKILSSAMDEYTELLEKGAKTAGNPWKVC